MCAALDAVKRLMRIPLDQLKIRAGATAIGHEQDPLWEELGKSRSVCNSCRWPANKLGSMLINLDSNLTPLYKLHPD